MNDKRSVCKSCGGDGVVDTGFDPVPTKTCSACDGTGEQPATVATEAVAQPNHAWETNGRVTQCRKCSVITANKDLARYGKCTVSSFDAELRESVRQAADGEVSEYRFGADEPVAQAEVVDKDAATGNPTNRFLFKQMCAHFGIELGVDRVDGALLKIDAVAKAEKPVAQGGGVDVEKVMALVQEFGEQCEVAGYLDRSGSQDASKKLHEAAYQTAVKIRALLASPAPDGTVGDGWMPIETAPKDGTVFLIGFNEAARMRGARAVYEARWCTAQEKFTSVNGFILFDGATHWQPLPAEPAIAKQEPQNGR